MSASPAPKVLTDEFEVMARLAAFGLQRSELVDVALAAIAARNDADEILDPASAGGLLSYIYGTRALRQLLLTKGWAPNHDGQIESSVSGKLGVKFVFQNVDEACNVDCLPRAISGKGSAARQQVAEGQGDMFLEELHAIVKTQDPALVVWFFCVAVDGRQPVAELLCPRRIEDKQFQGYVERIFVLRAGDLDQLIPDEYESEPLSEPEVTVTRKQ